MYSRKQIKRALNSPNLIGRELNRQYYRQFGRQSYNRDGADILEEDWDILVILDACRYDMFEELNTIEGSLESRESRGSSTVEFLHGNFEGKSIEDTVYVTANPQLYRHSDSINADFHDVIDVWLNDGWDDEYGTVLPETTTEYALRAADKYPQKRLIIHYIQPHYPFLTEETTFDKNYLEHDEIGAGDFWNRQMEGRIDVSTDEVWELYNDNLREVLTEVRRLVNSTNGKTVVTSDHGNMVGERCFPVPVREWGHPRGIYAEPLVKVPWLVINDQRRKVVAKESDGNRQQETTDEVVKERLADLGYVE